MSSSLLRIPQVPSNSVVAQSIRCALAETVIAQELSNCIFQDFYVPRNVDSTEGTAFRNVLTKFMETHTHQATAIRCQMAKIFAESSYIDETASQAVENVCGILNTWLHDDTTNNDGFKADLTALFSELVNVWMELQHCGQRLAVFGEVTEGTWFENEDRKYEYDDSHGEEPQSTGPSTSDLVEPIAILFPQILAGEDLVFHGYALFSTQAVVTQAIRERHHTLHPQNTVRTYRVISSGDEEQQMQKHNRRLNDRYTNGARNETALLSNSISGSIRSSIQRSTSVPSKRHRSSRGSTGSRAGAAN